MISILQKISVVCAIVLLFGTSLPGVIHAQNSVTYSVSPTIFDMTATPGQTWRSTVRVINPNKFDLTLYLDVSGFVPKGEDGIPQFLKKDEVEALSLPNWITSDKEFTVPAEKTIEIPFTIAVPQDAPPGGHYAALLVSTKPAPQNGEETKVQTSQVISSLVFLRVTGNIAELSSIRSFRTADYIVSRPETTFDLRIENKGNVHVLPQGEIKIYNMWGQERGIVPINQQTLFGNVLPNSVRKYSFTWKGDWSFSDIGRYTAVATLAYGSDTRQFLTADTAFWIIPWKFLLALFTGLGSVIWLISWGIKLFVRKMLALAGVTSQPTVVEVPPTPLPKRRGRKPVVVVKTRQQKIAEIMAPIEVSILDLRTRLKDTKSFGTYLQTVIEYLKGNWQFFIVLIAVLTLISGIILFVKEARSPNRNYEVTIENGQSDIVVTKKEIDDSKTKAESHSPRGSIKLMLMNRTGSSTALETATQLAKQEGFSVVAAKEDESGVDKNTVIVYHRENAALALELSKLFKGALLSVFVDGSAPKDEITVFLGTDQLDSFEE